MLMSDYSSALSNLPNAPNERLTGPVTLCACTQILGTSTLPVSKSFSEWRGRPIPGSYGVRKSREEPVTPLVGHLPFGKGVNGSVASFWTWVRRKRSLPKRPQSPTLWPHSSAYFSAHSLSTSSVFLWPLPVHWKRNALGNLGNEETKSPSSRWHL